MVVEVVEVVEVVVVDVALTAWLAVALAAWEAPELAAVAVPLAADVEVASFAMTGVMICMATDWSTAMPRNTKLPDFGAVVGAVQVRANGVDFDEAEV